MRSRHIVAAERKIYGAERKIYGVDRSAEVNLVNSDGQL